VGPTLLGQAYANGGGLYNKENIWSAFLLDEFRLQSGVLGAGGIETIYNTTRPGAGDFTVTGVAVSPGQLRVEKGASLRFVAAVSGENGPAQDVTWSLSGAASASTSIDENDGTLTIGADESSAALTVTATSNHADVSGSAAVTVKAPRADGKIRFGALADIHMGASVSNNARAEKAMQFFSDPALDADRLLVVGDLSGVGSAAELNVFREAMGRSIQIPLIATMGNHEENEWQNFENATGNKATDVKIVNGYYFIMLSPGAGELDETTGRSSGSNNGNYSYLRSWAAAKVAEAEAADPTKPIFVFVHHPITDTYYVSDHYSDNGLTGVFDDHPRVVYFAGHIHSPNNHPRSIYQDDGFTAVNVPAVCSADMEPGMINGSVRQQMSQGLLVDADAAGNVTLTSRDFLSDQWIEDQVWSFNVNGELPYTAEKRQPLAKAPVFPENAEIRLSNLNRTSVDIEFDQAIMPENGAADIVHSYRFDFVEKATGNVGLTFKDWSEFYIRPLPPVIREQALGLRQATEYELRIYAFDAYGLMSEDCLSKTFTTTAVDTAPKRPLDYALTFDGGLANAGRTPAAVSMFTRTGTQMTGIETYESGKRGQAVKLNKQNFITLDNDDIEHSDDSALIDYSQSFSVAFWINVQSARLDGEAGILSNKNVDNLDSNSGYAIRTRSIANANPSPATDTVPIKLEYKPLNGIGGTQQFGDIALGEWVHLAATFDYANNEVTVYKDGVAVSTAEADLSGGIGGVSGIGRLRNTFLGSSPWNYTEEHGGFNGSGTGGRHDVEFLADDFVMSGCVLTREEIAALMNDISARPQISLVGFDADGGAPAPAAQPVATGRFALEPPLAPEKAGHTFDGWYLAGATAAFDFAATPITGDTAIKARWTAAGADEPDGNSEEPDDGAEEPDDEGPVADIPRSGGSSGGGGTTPGLAVPKAEEPKTETGTETASGGSAGTFGDVQSTDWFYADVEFVVSQGLFNGTGDNAFSPNLPMTRGMIATVLGRLCGADVSAYADSVFDDVAAGQYYTAYVEWAKDNGIVNGVGGKLFAPNSEVSRQDFAVLLMRCAAFANLQFPVTQQSGVFADEADIADYAKNAVRTLYNGGIINGVGENAINPKGSATRAEVAAMLHRFIEKAQVSQATPDASEGATE
jgi:uncharacterized repeat protein (TIGR02543 family)